MASLKSVINLGNWPGLRMPDGEAYSREVCSHGSHMTVQRLVFNQAGTRLACAYDEVEQCIHCAGAMATATATGSSSDSDDRDELQAQTRVRVFQVERYKGRIAATPVWEIACPFRQDATLTALDFDPNSAVDGFVMGADSHVGDTPGAADGAVFLVGREAAPRSCQSEPQSTPVGGAANSKRTLEGVVAPTGILAARRNRGGVHCDGVSCIKFSTSGRLLAAAGMHGEVSFSAFSSHGGALQEHVTALQCRSHVLVELTWSSCDKRFAITASKTCTVYDVASKVASASPAASQQEASQQVCVLAKLYALETVAVRCMAFSPLDMGRLAIVSCANCVTLWQDGAHVASCADSSSSSNADENEARYWGTSHKRVGDDVCGLFFQAKGCELVTVAMDATVIVTSIISTRKESTSDTSMQATTVAAPPCKWHIFESDHCALRGLVAFSSSISSPLDSEWWRAC